MRVLPDWASRDVTSHPLPALQSPRRTKVLTTEATATAVHLRVRTTGMLRVRACARVHAVCTCVV